MFIKKLKNINHSPRHIIFYGISKYLDDNTYKSVLDQLGRESPKQDRKFLSILKQHFNLELLKDKPLIWQDIWIYNYLKYNYDGHKFSRIGLLAKYEKEIVLPSEKALKEISIILDIY